MLLCKNFCRNHNRTLTTIFRYQSKSYNGNYCFSGTDIPLYKPVHNIARTYIAYYVTKCILLSPGQFIWQFIFYLFFNIHITEIKNRLFFCVVFFQLFHRSKEMKEFIKYKTFSRIYTLILVFRKMNAFYSFFPQNKIVFFSQCSRQEIFVKFHIVNTVFYSLCYHIVCKSCRK